MASAGATFPIDLGSAEGQHFLIVEARYFAGLADELLRGATLALDTADASYDIVSVPGILEIPSAVAMAVEAGDYDGFIALGTIVHDEAVHDSYMIAETTRALLELSVVDTLPLGFALISVKTEAQAWVQARVEDKDKGGAAARAAIAMAALKLKLNA